MNQPQRSRKGYIPNERLKAERLRLNLSHKNVADQIDLPDPHTVGRWERGESFPQPHYRQKLCRLFGKDAEELGLVKDRPVKGRSTQDALVDPAATPLCNIPTPLLSFLGREQDLTTVCGLLKTPEVRLVNLTGPGGVGKTSLSIEVAHAMQEQMSGGVCFLSLAALTDPILVLPMIAQALIGEGSRGQSALEQIRYVLDSKPFLLVLDNFEQVVSAATCLEELLAASQGLKILVTSREVLHLQSEQEFMLRPLAVPDLDHLPTLDKLMQYEAITLFVQRAQSHLPSFQLTPENARPVAEICVRLDGLPLAIELAATYIKLFPPNALLARLSQGLQLLKSQSRSLPERQRTLSNAIQWSYDLLQEPERWLFRRLALFPDGCTLEAAEALLSQGVNFDIVEGLASLVDKSLLQQKERDDYTPCFLMLETLRAYGWERLRELGEEEEGQEKLAGYYLALVEQAKLYLNGELQAQWLTLLEQERKNLRAALTWLIRAQRTELALRFCEVFGKFCGLRGDWGEEQKWLQAVLDLPQCASARAIRARVLRRAGHLAYRLRDLKQARLLQEESVALSLELGDKQNLAGALSGLAWTFYRQGEMESVSRLLSESVTAARESGSAWSLANVLESQGRLLHIQGQLDESRCLLDESVTLARKVGDKETLARILTTLVAIALAQGDIEQAQSSAQESSALAQELGTRPLIALALKSLGDVALAQREYMQARQLYEQGIVQARELGDLPNIAVLRLQLGRVALAQGDLPQAKALVEESLKFFREQGDNPNIAASLSLLEDIKRRQQE